MKRFVSFTTSDDNNTFFYPINDILSAKFYSQNDELNNKLTLELRIKSSTDIEVFYFDTVRNYQDAIDAFNDL